MRTRHHGPPSPWTCPLQALTDEGVLHASIWNRRPPRGPLYQPSGRTVSSEAGGGGDRAGQDIPAHVQRRTGQAQTELGAWSGWSDEAPWWRGHVVHRRSDHRPDHAIAEREQGEASGREVWEEKRGCGGSSIHTHKKTGSLSGATKRCDVFFQVRWSPLWNHCFLPSYRPAPKHARGQTLDRLCRRPIGDS